MLSTTPDQPPGARSFTSPVGWVGMTLLTAALVVLYQLSRVNYLLFHALVELFAVVVACGTFMIAWHARRFLANGFFLIIGTASLGVAFIDLLHTLAYKNMGVFPAADANLPTQLWIAARWLQVVALFAAPFFLARKPHPLRTLAVGAGLTVLLLAAIFWWRIFPDCFREGSGLTPFKIASEYLFVLLLAATIALLRRRRDGFDPGVLRLLSTACGAFLLAELSFTLYTDVFGITNMAGHLFKVIGCYCIYRAVIETGLARPFDLLFRELKQNETALRQRTAALEVANRDLEAFNYSVSHDLRGPLTVILGQSEVLLHLFGGQLNAEVRQFITGIVSETHRMNELIDTLLNFARLGVVELERQPVDLSAKALMIAQRMKLGEPGRQVVFDIAPGSVPEADPDLADVILENLLGNAWKYTRQTPAAKIDFGNTRIEGQNVFFVRDNGIGFDMTQSAGLFEPFRRLHAAKDGTGFGIGLATVKRIIDRHGGRIWAESSPGQGATFYFTL